MSPSAKPSQTFSEVCEGLRGRILAFLEEKPDHELLRSVQSQVRVSMEVIDEALKRYGPEHLSLSYNGGKDCLVLLVLLLACLPTWAASSSSSSTHETANGTASQPSNNTNTATAPDANRRASRKKHSHEAYPDAFRAVYVACHDPFPEVEEFVSSSAQEYHLDVAHYRFPMKPALQRYLDAQPEVQAIFVGTRRADPHGEFLKHFDPTDGDWPRFMRVHPVVDWRYTEIWAFIRHLKIPYCHLYDLGYTSLGSISNTHPNPALLLVDGASSALSSSGNTKFRPAYQLTDNDKERLGRDQ